MDVCLPDGNGLEALPRFRKLPSEPEVIIVTGVSPAEGAEQAIKSGAWDYVHKPFAKEEVVLHITRTLEFRKKKTASRKISVSRDLIIGNSRELNSCIDQVAQCAGNDVNVLITGETGTGKELFAETIHKNSTRADKPFIVVDCASLPDNLIESILCGHKKGAFTGADKDQAGLVKQADGGTLFLDEVGELSLSFQKKFLRILQERTFRPVGGDKEVRSNFRLISATNRDLDALVAEDKFRSDLIYRLRTFHIHIPPLRERTSDIKELLQHYVLKIAEKHGVQVKGYKPEFLNYLSSYPWPGNVREFVNCLEKAVLTDPENPTLYHMHLPMEIRIHHAKGLSGNKDGIAKHSMAEAVPEDALADFSLIIEKYPVHKVFKEKVYEISERQYLGYLMTVAGNNKKKACEISEMSESHLYALLRKFQINR